MLKKIEQKNCEFTFRFTKYSFKQEFISDNLRYPRPFFAITLPLEGSMRFETEKPFTAQKNDLVFIPRGVTYKGFWSANTSYIALFFNVKSFDYSMDSYSYKIQKISPPEIERIKNYFFEGLKQFNNKNDFLNSCKILFNILTEVLPLLNKKKINYSPNIKNAVDYIENNYTIDFKVDELAKIAFMSTSRFYPQFKKETGLSPIDYKNKVRIEHAVTYLSTSSYSIEDLTTILGFNSSVYFRKVFRKIMGENPSTFSKSIYKI